MHRTERLDLILRRLIDRPGITVKELCREFDLSERSLYRDLNLLKSQGHPIEGSVGRGGGIRLHPSWGLGKVALSVEQSIGTLVSLAIAEKIGLPLFHSDLKSVRHKISSAFSSAQRPQIRRIQDRIFIGEPASQNVRSSYSNPDPKVMRTLEKAFVSEKRLQIEYENEKKERSLREIEPHGLFVNWPAWYLLGIDCNKEATRIFRVDRIYQAVQLETSFRPKAIQLFEEQIGCQFGSAL